MLKLATDSDNILQQRTFKISTNISSQKLIIQA